MSRIEASMEDMSNKGNVSDSGADEGGPNHIRLDTAVLCQQAINQVTSRSMCVPVRVCVPACLPPCLPVLSSLVLFHG